MTRPFRVAIVGAGIGREHLRAYLALPNDYTVTHLCDIDAARARAVIADEGGSALPVADMAPLLANPSLDIVDICLPPHLHFAVAMQALAAGKHVICEKPMVASLAEADALIAATREHGRRLTPVFQYRYGPAMAALRALVAADLAGKPLVASIETHWNRQAGYYANPWRGTWKGEQGGAVLGHAIHNHDLLCAVFGPIARLSAFVATRVNEIEVEDCAAISFQMANGALATSSVTLGAATDTSRLRFVFDRLTAESGTAPYAPATGHWTFTARGEDAEARARQAAIDAVLAGLPEGRSGFAGFLAAQAAALRGEAADVVTIEDGRASLDLVTAIYDAARTGRVVDLPLDRTSALYDSWLP